MEVCNYHTHYQIVFNDEKDCPLCKALDELDEIREVLAKKEKMLDDLDDKYGALQYDLQDTQKEVVRLNIIMDSAGIA